MIRHFALALAFASLPSFAQGAVEPPRYNQVDLQAEVSREVPNDLMIASLAAEVADASAARAADQANRIAAEALKVAAEFRSVQTRSGLSQTLPVYDRQGKLTGWRARSEIRLETRDVPAGAALIGRLQATMQLRSVVFTVSPELRRQVENELMTDAVAAFRARAEIAARAIGGRSYRIRRVAINTGGFVPGPRAMAAARPAAAAADEVAPPAFEAGSSTVQVSANGSVEVE
jgi:predicted secreted protein